MGCGCWIRMITQSGRLKAITLWKPWVIKTTSRFQRPRQLVRLVVTQFLRIVMTTLVAALLQLMQKFFSCVPVEIVDL